MEVHLERSSFFAPPNFIQILLAGIKGHMVYGNQSVVIPFNSSTTLRIMSGMKIRGAHRSFSPPEVSGKEKGAIFPFRSSPTASLEA